jgi:hypothetical protein
MSETIDLGIGRAEQIVNAVVDLEPVNRLQSLACLMSSMRSREAPANVLSFNSPGE